LEELFVPKSMLKEGNKVWIVDLVYCVKNLTSNNACKSLIVTNNVKNQERVFDEINEYVEVKDGMEMEIFNKKYKIKV